MEELDLLILGAGWSATFLIPLLLKSHSITFAATTTTGHPVSGHPTIPFRFDPTSPDQSGISSLPRARTVLVTFPLNGIGPSRVLVENYRATHSARGKTEFRFVQLGSTGIWQKGGPTLQGDGNGPWVTRHSPYDEGNSRAIAEDELRRLGGCVLELSGLWGGQRDPQTWVGRVAKTKEDVKEKKSLHLIHGMDVARAVIAIVKADEKLWEKAGKGQRWMLTDGFVYDWWALFAGWAEPAGGESGSEGDEVQPTDQAKWVAELMVEEDVRGLPRSMEALGRCYDSREFWSTFGLVPLKARV